MTDRLPTARCTIQIVDVTGTPRHIKKLTLHISGERALKLLEEVIPGHMVYKKKRPQAAQIAGKKGV